MLLMFIICLSFLMCFWIFCNGVFYGIIVRDSHIEGHGQSPFFQKWTKEINDDQDTVSGKIFMSLFYLPVTIIALFSYLGSLFRSK